MHFCENCGNMFYIELNKNDPDTLIYYCRNCGNKNDKLINELNNNCVSKTHIIIPTYLETKHTTTKLTPFRRSFKFNRPLFKHNI